MLGLIGIFAAAAVAMFIGAVWSPIAGMIVILGAGVLLVLMEQSLYTVYGVDGEHQTPYMTRLIIGRFRLHIFWRGDADPDPHDHPWGFWTFPLVTYEEEVTSSPDDSDGMAEFLGLDPGVFVSRHIVERFRFHYRPATHTHRVLGAVQEVTTPGSMVRLWKPTGKPIITLVWTERVTRPWGFLVRCEGFFRWTPWRQYVYEGGHEAACAPKPGANTDE